jgi:hypothetical protein
VLVLLDRAMMAPPLWGVTQIGMAEAEVVRAVWAKRKMVALVLLQQFLVLLINMLAAVAVALLVMAVAVTILLELVLLAGAMVRIKIRRRVLQHPEQQILAAEVAEVQVAPPQMLPVQVAPASLSFVTQQTLTPRHQ